MKIYLEIRACAGGKEAELFSEEIMNMYLKYAKKNNINIDLIENGKTKIILLEGKEKEVSLLISETGIHRVQRISKTGKKDKMHTSTVSVAVLEVLNSTDTKIKDNDLEITSFKASGNGGQHVNTTDSAVRIKHIPSGIVVSSQSERSQYQNKFFAMEMLISKLRLKENEEKSQQTNQLRKEQVLNGDRSEARRTYNFERNEVLDTLSNKRSSIKEILDKGNLSLIK